MEKLFHLKEHGTNVKTEILAGITTFLAMAYILAVNPAILGQAHMSHQGVFLATAISAGAASIFMGLMANYPVSLAPGMGVNALFTYTIVGQMGLSPEGALACVFVSGIIFVIITVTNIRRMIINAIPAQLKLAIGAGIGFFVAFVGLKNAGIVVASESTFVALGNLKDPTVPTASASNARSTFTNSPFSSIRSAFDATATNVPAVSKKSTNNNEKIATIHCG